MPDSTISTNSTGMTGTTERCMVTTDFREAVAVTTTETSLFKIDSAQFGGVAMCVTIRNRSGSASSIRIRAYVSNDNGRMASNVGRVTLSAAYDETDTSVSLPHTLAANSVKHLIVGYKQQPQLTTFRFWEFTVDVASGSATIDAYINAK